MMSRLHPHVEGLDNLVSNFCFRTHKSSSLVVRQYTCLGHDSAAASRMGKVPVRLKEVVYTISPFETTVLTGVFKDVPGKLHKYWKEKWLDIGVFFVLPTYATFWYANDYKEKEKMHHRY